MAAAEADDRPAPVPLGFARRNPPAAGSHSTDATGPAADCGRRSSRPADFHDIEPELSEQAVYGEYEDDLQLTEVDDMAQWCGYVNGVIADRQLPMLAADARRR